MKIVLASGSPRRKELLENLGLKIEVRPTGCDETVSAALSPEEYVKAAATKKLEGSIPTAKADELIIAADTMVFFEDKKLGKPKNEADAFAMLKNLSGNTHKVCTGIALYYGGKLVSGSECTVVYFKSLSDRDIENYIKTGEPSDKAGAYGIQGKGSVFVEKIDGDYFNVVGLPLSKLFTLIKEGYGEDLYSLLG